MESKSIPILTKDEAVNEKVVEFPDWNAKSVYFYDAEENILEFIARYNLKTTTDEHVFGLHHILNVSEIAFSVEDNTHFANVVKEHTGGFLFPVSIFLKSLKFRNFFQNFKIFGN